MGLISLSALFLLLGIGSYTVGHVYKPIGALVASLQNLGKEFDLSSGSVPKALAVDRGAKRVFADRRAKPQQLSHFSARETTSVFEGLMNALPDVWDPSKRVTALKAELTVCYEYDPENDVSLLQRSTSFFRHGLVNRAAAKYEVSVETTNSKLKGKLNSAARALHLGW